MELLLKYFPELTPTQVAQYTQAVSLYKEWKRPYQCDFS